jgi:hypothetical protein
MQVKLNFLNSLYFKFYNLTENLLQLSSYNRHLEETDGRRKTLEKLAKIFKLEENLDIEDPNNKLETIENWREKLVLTVNTIANEVKATVKLILNKDTDGYIDNDFRTKMNKIFSLDGSSDKKLNDNEDEIFQKIKDIISAIRKENGLDYQEITRDTSIAKAFNLNENIFFLFMDKIQKIYGESFINKVTNESVKIVTVGDFLDHLKDHIIKN